MPKDHPVKAKMSKDTLTKDKDTKDAKDQLAIFLMNVPGVSFIKIHDACNQDILTWK